MSRDDRLIGLATFAVADAERIGSLYEELPGVLYTTLGRAGGRDAVQLEFDPGRISYAALLDVLERGRDDTAAVLWHSPEQARLAAGRFPVQRAPLFYRGEERRPRSLDPALS